MKRSVRVGLCAFVIAIAATHAFAQFSVESLLDGSQAGTMSDGTGTAFGRFSADLKTLTFQVTVAGLSGPIGAAHFHIFPAGTVVHPISFTGNTATGTWTDFPDSLIRYFVKGDIYINVHTAMYPAGEISGFLSPVQFMFTVDMNGQQAGTSSTARGTGLVRWGDPSGPGGITMLAYSITIAELNGAYSAAHFHMLPGKNVVHPIVFTDSTAIGTWEDVPDSMLIHLLRGKLYVNVHSSTFPAGEIAGAVVPRGEIPFAAAMDGNQAGTVSTGQGTAFLVLSADAAEMRYAATYGTLTGIYSAAHFHTSTTGSVIRPLAFFAQAASGVWRGFTDTNLVDLLRGRVYLNVHSSTNPAGEIRGDLKYYDGTFTSLINGGEAGNPSLATGTAWMRLGTDGDSSEYRVTWTGLTGAYTNSHFHLSPGGRVVHPLKLVDTTTAQGAWLMPDSLYGGLLRNQLYLNVHSTVYPAGEIRGTVMIGSGKITTVGRVEELIPAAFELDQNYPNPFNPATTIRFSITDPDVVTLAVYNILGQRLSTLLAERREAGTYSVTFDGRSLASGVYFYRLSTHGGQSMTRRMVIMK